MMKINIGKLIYNFQDDGAIRDIEAGYSTYDGRESFNANIVITQDDLPQGIERYNAEQLDLQAKRIIREITLGTRDESEEEEPEDVEEEESTEE